LISTKVGKDQIS